MTWWLAVVLLIVTINPPRRRSELGGNVRVIAAGAAITLFVVVVLGALGDWILDSLDITAPTFRVAVGLVLIARGVLDLIRSPAEPVDRPGWLGAVAPVFFPVLFRPELGLIAISVAVDAGLGPMLLGAAIGLALVVAATARLHDAGYGRALGAVFSTALIILAVDRLIDGVFAL
jgi:small neutral amino acid transporter SnatA (MarC family)